MLHRESITISIVFFSICSAAATFEFNDEFIKSSNFIDKSLLFLEIFRVRCGEPAFVTFPPKFGKTTNLLMLKKLLQFERDFNDQAKPMERTSAYHLVQNLKLAQHEAAYLDHLAQHPVILLDLKYDVEGEPTHEKLVAGLVVKVQQVFEEYEWLGQKLISSGHPHSNLFQNALRATFSPDELQDSLYLLSEILHGYFNESKVVLMVDNFDYVSKYDFVESYVTDPVFSMIRGIILKAIKSSYCHKRSLILSVSDRKVGAPMYGNIRQFPFLEEDYYSPFFGILPTELDQLFERYQCSEEEKTNVKKWYDGYQTNLVYRPIYNTYSITEYFRHRNEPNALRPYWAQVQDTEFIRQFLRIAFFRTMYNELVRYGAICCKIRKRRPLADKKFLPNKTDNEADVHIRHDRVQNLAGLLFEQGYLGHKNYIKEGSYKIPNLEIENLLVQVAIQFYQSYDIEVIRLVEDLMIVLNETDSSTDFLQAANFEFNAIPMTVSIKKARFLTSVEVEYFNMINLATSYIKLTVPGTEVILKWLTGAARDDIVIVTNGKAMLIRFDEDPNCTMPSNQYMCKCIKDRNITMIKLLGLSVFGPKKVKCLVRTVECGARGL